MNTVLILYTTLVICCLAHALALPTLVNEEPQLQPATDILEPQESRYGWGGPGGYGWAGRGWGGYGWGGNGYGWGHRGGWGYGGGWRPGGGFIGGGIIGGGIIGGGWGYGR